MQDITPLDKISNNFAFLSKPVGTSHCSSQPTVALPKLRAPVWQQPRAALGFSLHCSHRPSTEHTGHLHPLPALLTAQLCCHGRQLPHAELTTCAPASRKPAGLRCTEQPFLKPSAGLSHGLLQLHCYGQTGTCLFNLFSQFDFSTQSLILTAPSS